MHEFLIKGKKALAIGAWEEARDELERAVQSESSAEALEELAWAYWWLNDMPKVFEIRAQAHQAFLEKNDKPGASRTASWLGLTYLEYNGEFAIASGWFQRAESLLENIDECREHCLIKSLKANLAFRVERNIPQAIALLDETIALSKSLQYSEELMLAEALKGFVLVTRGMVKEGMQLLDEATVMALSEQSGNIHSITTTCCFLIDACQRVRDYDRAGQWCIKVKEICKRWRHKAVFAYCRTQYASLLISKGEYKDAEVELTIAIEELKIFKPVSVHLGLVRMADLRRRQGRWTEAMALFEKIQSQDAKALALAELLYDQDELHAASELVEKFLRQVPVHEKTQRIAGLELGIKINVLIGQHDSAEQNLLELEEIANAINTLPLQAVHLSSRGILHLYRGHDHEKAKEDLQDAIDLYDQLQCPFEAARLRVFLAQSWDYLNQHPKAEEELNKAIGIFKALDAKRDLEKSRKQLKTPHIESRHEYGLTKRELNILKLVAEGKNNDQIADRLSISLRTVEKHLSNIYEKLGTSGKSARAHAAAFASKKSLFN